MSQHKTGLLGGTFNPVHRGHIELGLKIKDAFGLDRVLFILSARPPHKKRQSLPPAELRLAMLQAALKPHPGLETCDLELHRQGDSWTIDTIAELKAAAPGERFYFITGSEGFLKIRTWREYRRLLAEVFFIIILRRPSHRPKVERLLREEGVPLRPGPDDPGPEPSCIRMSRTTWSCPPPTSAARSPAARTSPPTWKRTCRRSWRK
jgi:nicotinate (nicotinamide) nucleotide adenylyltransferase